VAAPKKAEAVVVGDGREEMHMEAAKVPVEPDKEDEAGVGMEGGKEGFGQEEVKRKKKRRSNKVVI
jgi:hypothetical protein